MGKPIEQAVGEVEFAGAIYEFYAENAESLMADEPIQLLGGEGTAIVRRSAYGVLLGIMPWNYPYYQVARFAGPNHIIGNTLLLKHAPQCPESAAAIAQIFKDAGYPEGCYENIYATNEQIEWVIADPRVRGVSVTGSERAGAAVAADRRTQPQEGGARARRLRPVHPARHRRRRRRSPSRPPKRAWRTPARRATRPSASSSSTASTTSSSSSSRAG